MAAVAGVEPGGITFTSGGTEADNPGGAGLGGSWSRAIVVSAVEHPAVMEAAMASGQEVRVAPVGSDGLIDEEALERLLDSSVTVVSVQLANHETGVLQPTRAGRAPGSSAVPRAVLHTDAVQAGRWIDLTVAAASADLISLSGHKMGGPQGTGVLAWRGRPELRAILHGGRQERELRSGTQNVAGIVGLAAAALVARSERAAVSARVRSLRDDLASRLGASLPDAIADRDRLAAHARAPPSAAPGGGERGSPGSAR